MGFVMPLRITTSSPGLTSGRQISGQPRSVTPIVLRADTPGDQAPAIRSFTQCVRNHVASLSLLASVQGIRVAFSSSVVGTY
ncbi:hypothetical protein H2203_003025 [Taxawa tesnikishii (nom. ined.)]|nr:hypothetical protein H2203_003025 [Dothideales sp. JES 119]